jgi:hypothetical protein
VGEHEEVNGNLLVCSVGAGVVGVVLLACEQELWRDTGDGLRWSGERGRHGEVVENQQVESDPFRASVWAEEERKVGLDSTTAWRVRVGRGGIQGAANRR